MRLSTLICCRSVQDPALSRPGRLGPGIPVDWSGDHPYRYAFGCDPGNPLEIDLTETVRFAVLCAELGVQLLNLTAGSPYYNPHLQRPAAYPPSDGYQPPEDPLVGVARQMAATRRVRRQLLDALATSASPARPPRSSERPTRIFRNTCPTWPRRRSAMAGPISSEWAAWC